MKTKRHTLRERLWGLLLLTALFPLIAVAVLATSRGGTWDQRHQAQIKPAVVGESQPIAAPRFRVPGTLDPGDVVASAPAPSSGGASSTIWMALAALAAGPLIVLWALLRERVRGRPPTFAGEAALQRS